MYIHIRRIRFEIFVFSRMDPEEEGDFVELDEGNNEAPMDSDGDDFEETEEERQMQFEELDENGKIWLFRAKL